MARRSTPLPRPSARGPRTAATAAAPVPTPTARRRARWVLAAAVAAGAVVIGVSLWVHASGRSGRWRARAEAAARAGDWPAALAAWRAVNAGPDARGPTLLGQARAAVATGRLAEAERALARATAADPTAAGPWRLWLELLRVEDRSSEAQAIGWAAFEAVPPADRRDVLLGLTLALLAEVPDDVARPMLTRWSEAAARSGLGGAPDPDARVALLQRIDAMPRADDPGRAARIGELTAILERDPGHLAARAVLIAALADAGEPALGRERLDAWPEAGRDVRYWRLVGRWDLDFDHRPDRAEAAFRRTLEALPHDWKTRARLARALKMLGREAEARAEAEAVAQLRERLDPEALGPRLSRADPADLAELTASVGLSRLADAWRALARAGLDQGRR